MKRLSVAARSLLRIAAWVSVAALIASCSISRPSPVKEMYLLEPAPPAALATPKNATVRLGAITMAAPFRDRVLVYRRSEVKYESEFYSEFFVSPSAMLADATVKALSAANVFRRVMPSGAGPDDADYVLDGFASELYGDVREPGKTTAAMTITYYLSSTSSLGSSVVWTATYRQRVPAANANPESLVQAWNSALSAILADLARDLAAATLPKQ